MGSLAEIDGVMYGALCGKIGFGFLPVVPVVDAHAQDIVQWPVNGGQDIHLGKGNAIALGGLCQQRQLLFFQRDDQLLHGAHFPAKQGREGMHRGFILGEKP